MALIHDQKLCLGLEQEFGYSEPVLEINRLDFFDPNRAGRERALQFLPNGGRLYCDFDPVDRSVALPEYATPEHLSALNCTAAAFAGRRLIVEKLCHTPDSLLDVRSGRFGEATIGSHENYSWKGCLAELYAAVLPFLITRQIFTGIGGYDRDRNPVLSPRLARVRSTDYVSGCPEFTVARSRDEARHHQRIEVLCGDSNMLDLPLFLRLGTTALTLLLAEINRTPSITYCESSLRDDIRSCNGLQPSFWLLTGTEPKYRAAIDVQLAYCSAAARHLDLTDEGKKVVKLWEDTLEILEREDFGELDGRLDWVTNLSQGLLPDYTTLRADPNFSVISQEWIDDASRYPLDDTRARARVDTINRLTAEQGLRQEDMSIDWGTISFPQPCPSLRYDFPVPSQNLAVKA